MSERCIPVWGSCALPSGHGGQHNAYGVVIEHEPYPEHLFGVRAHLGAYWLGMLGFALAGAAATERAIDRVFAEPDFWTRELDLVVSAIRNAP